MAKKKPQQEPSDRPTFEEALERLEGIVRLLEDGQLGLSESLAQYEEGVGLLREAYDRLKHAERRIELLSGVDSQGNPVCRPFDDRATRAGEEQVPGRGTRQPPSEGAADADSPGAPAGESDVDSPGGLF